MRRNDADGLLRVGLVIVDSLDITAQELQCSFPFVAYKKFGHGDPVAVIIDSLRREIDYNIESLPFGTDHIGWICHHAVNFASAESSKSVWGVTDLEHYDVAVWIKAKLPGSKTGRRFRGITKARNPHPFPFQLTWHCNVAGCHNGVNQFIGNSANKPEARTCQVSIDHRRDTGKADWKGSDHHRLSG